MSQDYTELRKVQMELVRKLLDVCSRNGLRCWAEGGTLLGAVRHRGFIPWDDDVDMCMPREDYDKLLAIGAEEFKAPYFLQHAYSDVDYFRGHAQLRMDGTSAIRPSDSYRKFHQGIFIDIFPLDGVPEDPQEAEATVGYIRKIYKYLKSVNLNILYSGRIGLLGRKLKYRRIVRRVGWDKFYGASEDRLRQHPTATSGYWAEMSFFGAGMKWRREIFDRTVYLDFEDIKMPAPEGYDEFLRTQFGDNYMTPIQAPSCHGELVIDCHKPYQELLPQVWREYKRSMTRRLLRKVGIK